jgi:hypothetical protein
MTRTLALVGIGAALAMSLLTSTASAAPIGPANPVQAVDATETGDLLSNVRYRGHHYGYRRGSSFGFFLGAPVANCYWSRYQRRRVCYY